MIIEIIVLLCFLSSLGGFIFFVKHYFKSWKARSDNKRMLLAIESAEDENACYDRFYNNILRDIDWGRVVMVTFIIGIAIIVFWTFAAPNKEVSTGNQGVKENTQTPILINSSDNSTMLTAEGIKDVLSFDGAIPWWIGPIVLFLVMWWVFKRARYSWDGI